MTFRAKLLQAGKTATGFVVPTKVVESLGSGKRPPVRVTINGYTYRNTVAVMGGEFMIGVSAEHRAGAGVKAGDVLDITLELDTEPRGVTVPPALKKALARDATARRAFDGLSYTNRREIVESIEGAKTTETRERRLAKTINTLRARPA